MQDSEDYHWYEYYDTPDFEEEMIEEGKDAEQAELEES